jgi:hypothetical protein
MGDDIMAIAKIRPHNIDLKRLRNGLELDVIDVDVKELAKKIEVMKLVMFDLAMMVGGLDGDDIQRMFDDARRRIEVAERLREDK